MSYPCSSNTQNPTASSGKPGVTTPATTRFSEGGGSIAADAPVAQWIERPASTRQVARSTRARGTDSTAATKQCGRCEVTLPSDRFNRKRRNKDGLQHWCKSCIKEYQQDSPAFFEKARERSRKQHVNNKPQVYAKAAVHRAVKRGDLVRPDCCSMCDTTGPVDGHHWKGYDYPLDVQWLCRSCHVNIEPRRGVA